MRLRSTWPAAGCIAVACLAALAPQAPSLAQPATAPVKFGVHVSLSGPGQLAGKALLAAVRFAVDEANAGGAAPPFEIEVLDDRSTEDGARQAARDAVASGVGVVVGPTASTLGIAACPIYAAAGLPLIVSTIHADDITRCGSVFRTVVSTGEIGDTLANFLGHVLHGTDAAVIYKDDGYGRPLASRFREAATRLGIVVAEHAFATADDGQEAARKALADPAQPPLVLGMTYQDVVPILAALRRGGYRSPIFGTATMARASFNDLFAGYPESGKDPGYFSNGTYAVSPVILDSANARTLAFADRFRARTGQEPSWETVQGYDAARLAMAALRAATGNAAPGSPRQAAQAYLESLDSPEHALPGLLGPLWFSPGRIRHQVVRMGRFGSGLFNSATRQLVPVSNPEPAALASGAEFELEPGRFARIQRVVFTGVYINEVPRVDVASARFSADFYLWLRYAREAGPGAADPSDITLPTLVGGGFNAANPAERAEMPDGTLYRLWRVRADFSNDFDLHRYPFDQQTLQIPFFNATSSSDRIVYALDRRSLGIPGLRTSAAGAPAGPGAARASEPGASEPGASGSVPSAAATALRSLTQWQPVGTGQNRLNLITASSLGDLRRVGVEAGRELSGFEATVTLKRRVAATLVKNLLPLMLLTLIMFASLYFPHGLIKEKVTVAITAALSGTVLLTATNSQLGNVGYTIAVEYAFYAFFGLCVLCILSVLAAERLRVAKHPVAAVTVEQSSRAVFAVLVAATIVVAATLY